MNALLMLLAIALSDGQSLAARIASYPWTWKAGDEMRVDRTLIGYPDKAFGGEGKVIPEEDVDSVSETLSGTYLLDRGLPDHRGKPRHELAQIVYVVKFSWERHAQGRLKDCLEMDESAGLVLLAAAMEVQPELVSWEIDYPVFMKELKGLVAGHYPPFRPPPPFWVPA